MRPLVPVLIEQNWRNFWSTSFDDFCVLHCSTATLNVRSKSLCNWLMECLIMRLFPQPSGSLTIMGCSTSNHVLKRSIFRGTIFTDLPAKQRHNFTWILIEALINWSFAIWLSFARRRVVCIRRNLSTYHRRLGKIRALARGVRLRSRTLRAHSHARQTSRG